MADFEAAVTDTHALLYHAGGSRRLGRKAAAHLARAEEGTALVYVPAAVIWEVCLLARAGRFNLRRSARDFFADLFTNAVYQPYDLTCEQVVDATSCASIAIRSTHSSARRPGRCRCR